MPDKRFIVPNPLDTPDIHIGEFHERMLPAADFNPPFVWSQESVE